MGCTKVVGEWDDRGPLATFFWKGMRSIREGEAVAKEMTIEERMKEENQVREKTDEKGNNWRKLYFGGGAHFRNWLEQCKEIYGKGDVEIEEIKSNGFKCFDEGGEKIYRIWARIRKEET